MKVTCKVLALVYQACETQLLLLPWPHFTLALDLSAPVTPTVFQLLEQYKLVPNLGHLHKLFPPPGLHCLEILCN